ncbi:MAG: WG repeat-containing protein [Cytophagaceae bacterium]|nr:WG repeat-containing protein [Cytophagaceae bacterium]
MKNTTLLFLCLLTFKGYSQFINKKTPDGYYIEASNGHSMIYNSDFHPHLDRKFKYVSLSFDYNEKFNFINFSNDGVKRGVLDKSGKEIIPPVNGKIVPSASVIKECFIYSNEKGKVGIVDRNFKYLVPGIYSRIYDFYDKKYFSSEGEFKYKYNQIGYVVDINQKVGLLDPNFKEILKPDYQEIISYNNQLILKKDNKHAICEYDGKILTDFKYEEINIIGHNYYIVGVENKKGIVNTKGEYLLPPVYDKITPNFHLEYQRIKNDKLKDSIVSNEFTLIQRDKQFGLLINNTEFLKCQYDSIWKFNNANLLGFSKDFKLGFVNLANNEIFQTNYYQIKELNTYKDPLISVKQGNKFGLINYKNEIVLKPIYDSIEISRTGYLLKLNGKFGKFDDALNQKIEFNYDKIIEWNDSLYTAYDEQKSYIFLNKIKIFETERYDEIIPNFSNFHYQNIETLKFIDIKINNLVGRMKTDGKTMFKPKFQYVYFGTGHNGIECFAENGKYGLIDSLGNILVPPISDDIIYGREKNVTIISQNSKQILYNFNNGKISKNKYDKIEYSYPHHIIQNGNKKGIIDNNGDEILPPSMEDVNIYEWYSIIKKNGKYAYRNHNGTMITDFEFDDGYTFYKNLCPVLKNQKFGLIDSTGKYLVDFIYDKMENLGNNYFKVSQDGKLGVINTEGKLILNLNYSEYIETICRSGNCYPNKDIKYLTVINLNTSKTGLFDLNGKELLPSEFENIYYFNNGFIVDSELKSSYYDFNLNPIFNKNEEIKINRIDETYLAISKNNSSLKIYDASKKRYVSNTEYNDVRSVYLSQYTKVIFYLIQDKWGLMNSAGDLITNPIFDDFNIKEETILVTKNGVKGKVDLKGNFTKFE